MSVLPPEDALFHDDSLDVEDDADLGDDLGDGVDAGTPEPNAELLEELRALSDDTGYDFTQFPDTKSANAAHRLLVEQLSRAGYRPAPQPAAHAATDILPEDFGGEDEDEDDISADDELEEPVEKPTKKVRKTKREKLLEKQLAKERKLRQQDKQAQLQERLRQVEDRAEVIFDAMDHADFGKRGQRSVTQMQNAQRLFTEAWNLVAGAAQFGQKMTIEQAIRTAARHRGLPVGGKKKAKAETAPPDPQVGSRTIPGAAYTVNHGPALDPFGLTADKDFQRGAALLAAKMRGRR